MNNFAQISYNVGQRVGDSSALFGTIINGYINQRYQRIFKKFNWPTISPSFSISTIAGIQDYQLPTNFKHELYVYDATNKKDIPRVDFQELERIYSETLQSQGATWKCAIYDYLSSGVLSKRLRLFQTPNSVLSILIPYILQPTNMVATTDLPIIDMADLASELGATADAWRTKRQFQKAADFEVQYEKVIGEMIWSIENDPNRVVQFRPNVYPIHQLY